MAAGVERIHLLAEICAFFLMATWGDRLWKVHTLLHSGRKSAGACRRGQQYVVAHWYFDNADAQTQNIQHLLRLILRRISAEKTPIPKPVRKLARKHELAGTLPGTTALVKTLKDSIRGLDEDVFLVLDAIDEIQMGNEHLREEFLDLLVELGGARLPNLHVLVTSISDTDIKNSFGRLLPPPTSLSIEKPVSVDVNAYLDSTIERYAAEKECIKDAKGEIEEKLKGDG